MTTVARIKLNITTLVPNLSAAFIFSLNRRVFLVLGSYGGMIAANLPSDPPILLKSTDNPSLSLRLFGNSISK